MAAHLLQTARPTAWPRLRSPRRLNQASFAFTQEPETILEPGNPASVAWCHENISPIRGIHERTVLPVGVGLNALRYGLRAYRRARAKGLMLRNPIAYVIKKAEGVMRGEVRIPTRLASPAWH